MSLRKALLVGINHYPSSPLRGCIHDVQRMMEILTAFYGFTQQDLSLLIDEQATMKGILDGLDWLAEGGGEPQALRVFHYSGHGSYVLDINGDEPDGRDECLVPFDYQNSGMLTDDALKSIYDRFPRQGNLILVMDSCHSGSVQKDIEEDIMYRFLPVPFSKQEQMDIAASDYARARREFILEELHRKGFDHLSDEELSEKVDDLIQKFEKKRFGDIRVREANILLAGCRPDQQAADAPIHGQYHGAYTHFLAETIHEHQGQITYYELVRQTGVKLSKAHFTQIPQLECLARNKTQFAFMPFKN